MFQLFSQRSAVFHIYGVVTFKRAPVAASVILPSQLILEMVQNSSTELLLMKWERAKCIFNGGRRQKWACRHYRSPLSRFNQESAPPNLGLTISPKSHPSWQQRSSINAALGPLCCGFPKKAGRIKTAFEVWLLTGFLWKWVNYWKLF